MLKRTTLLLLLSTFYVFAEPSVEDGDTTTYTISDEEMAYLNWVDSVNTALEYRTDVVDVKNGLAELKVPIGYKYINPKQAAFILSDVWGNPPQECLGLILPEEDSPFDVGGYAIVLNYSEEGYVDDEDAQDLDYDDLLEEMQDDTESYNTAREAQGYPPIHMLDWASTPYYDHENKKLHWAKKLQFGDDDPDTVLNYDIRVLGRKGYMELSFIGGMDVLPKVQADMENILASVNFKEGNKYADFNPEIDEVAAYGIGGLIAGKVLAKAGFFVLLLKFWKIIAVGAVAAFAAVKKFLGFKKKETKKTDQIDSTS
jgi:uncharacterized membrane-anchored protein